MVCSEIQSFNLIIVSSKHMLFSYFPVIELPNLLPLFCTLVAADKCLHFTLKNKKQKTKKPSSPARKLLKNVFHCTAHKNGIKHF